MDKKVAPYDNHTFIFHLPNLTLNNNIKWFFEQIVNATNM